MSTPGGRLFGLYRERWSHASPASWNPDGTPAHLDRFDVVFTDSVNTLGLEPEQLRKYPKSTAFVYIFQTTKEGLFRGSQEFMHDVDTVIKVTNMTAVAEKNRFGGERKPVAV